MNQLFNLTPCSATFLVLFTFEPIDISSYRESTELTESVNLLGFLVA